VTIVDNASTDNSPAIIREKFPEIQIIENTENRGYAGAVNDGMRATKAPFAIISNADVEFFNNSIELLKKVLKNNPRIGAAGPQQVFPDGKWQRSYGVLPGLGEAARDILMITYLNNLFKRLSFKKGKKKGFKKVQYLDGAVIAVSRDAFKTVGGFDEDFFFYSEESDFCLRLKKNGFRVVHVPEALVLHHRGGSSTKSEVSERFYTLLVESKMKLMRKHFPLTADLFARLEIAHSWQMIGIGNLLKILSMGRFKNRAAEIFAIQKSAFLKELSKKNL
jgi:GT2 family glycosyltransferase